MSNYCSKCACMLRKSLLLLASLKRSTYCTVRRTRLIQLLYAHCFFQPFSREDNYSFQIGLLYIMSKIHLSKPDFMCRGVKS